jgi:hypothetical protein
VLLAAPSRIDGLTRSVNGVLHWIAIHGRDADINAGIERLALGPPSSRKAYAQHDENHCLIAFLSHHRPFPRPIVMTASNTAPPIPAGMAHGGSDDAADAAAGAS